MKKKKKMKKDKKEAPKLRQELFDEPYPTPEQLRIKGLADAISALMQVPSSIDSADYAWPLADMLFSCIKAMSGKAIRY